MRPTIKLTDDLIERQTRSNHSADYFVGSHTWHSEVSRTTVTVLTGVLAAHCIIDLLASEGRVNHHGLATQGRFDLF
jgi:hypothetical protein